MAATGYTPIQLYRTTTSGAAPTAGNLNDGELAININDVDVALYVKNQSGTVKRLMNNPAGLKYPTVDGTSNQVLKTDGAGLLSWVTAVLSGGALGTPSSGTLTNCTGLPVSTGVSGLAANVATFLATPSSANLAAALTDKTGTGANVFANAPTFPAQINLTANSGYNIYASGTADNYLAGSLGIGGTSSTDSLYVAKSISGSTACSAVSMVGVVQSTVTSTVNYATTYAQLQATAFTLGDLFHYRTQQAAFSGGAAVTSQYGFTAESTLTGATNNYGFYGGINASAGTTRYNLYMGGSADNYLGGATTISTNSSSNALRITQIGAGNALLVEDATNPDSTPIAIDSGGSMIIGHTTSLAGLFGVQARLQVVGNSGIQSNYNFSSSATAAGLWFTKSRNATVGSHTIVQSNDDTGSLLFSGSDGTAYVENARIAAQIDGTPGTNDMPGRLVFSTTSDGAAGVTERMRIDSSGNVGIGTSSPDASAILDAQSTTKGVRFPNMTTTQKNAIASPATGLVVFDTTLSKLCVYSGAAWQTITSI